MPEINEKVLLDCSEQNISKKEFTFTHASNLMKLQAEKKMNHWKLSPGQNLEVNKHGEIINVSPTRKSQDAAK